MRRLLLCIATLLSMLGARADEGMWMVTNLSARTDSILREMGLELTHDEIYSETQPSLNSAIVQFGGFCSGVVVSPDGLVFTNHHCGFGAIQSHSSTARDYLKHGFFAKRQKDELPNEELYVDFHVRTRDVTEQMLAALRPGMDEDERAVALDSMGTALAEAASDSANSIHAEVVPYYKGSKYYLSVYQRYSDVRLVFAPPQSLGKFGGDTDNWMWPRQTCDFSVFRIYAGKDNKPAEYSAGNVPFHPARYARVSTRGYEPGSFCMTFGYPGSTDRYLSSYGIDNTMRTTNALRIQVRGVKQAILAEAMRSSDALRIMYASKYAQSSNYWKFSIGQNKALGDLGVIAEKQALEAEVEAWARQKAEACRAKCGGQESSHCRMCLKYGAYATMLDSLKAGYAGSFEQDYARTLWTESFYNGSDIVKFALNQMMAVMDDREDDFKKRVETAFRDIDPGLDKRVFAALADNYRKQAPSADYLPDFYAEIDSAYGGDCAAYADALYARSVFARPADLAQAEDVRELVDDPMFAVAADLVGTILRMRGADRTGEYERLLGDAVREMNADKEYYPDANFTLRMSYGIVEGYETASATYACFTPSQSIIDKHEGRGDNHDYDLLPEVYAWLKKGKFGKAYTDARSNDLQLCFLTNNDITGGNSGSGMFDGKGRLIGLAFDGNWEAMSGDLKFDTGLQRCIGVDIRYVLSVIDRYGHGKRLIKELTLE